MLCETIKPLHMNQKIILLIVLVICGTVSAQIQVKSDSYSFRNTTVKSVNIKNRKVLSLKKSLSTILHEDEIDDQNGLPPRFGLKINANFNTKNSGTWIDLPDGGKLWRLPIKSPGALSINLLYDYFHLPPGGKLHIYNSQRNQVIGAFTEYNNKGTLKKPGKFATGLVYGDETILEYYHPRKAKHNPVISVRGVIHGYKYIRLPNSFRNETDVTPGHGSSGACQVNVNCVEGDNWQDEKRGVAMLLINDGTRWCSGSLINTSSNDGTPYFLTANHCIEEDDLDAGGDTDASQWIFYWNYEAPNCANTIIEPTINSTTGATLRANRSDTDFALFELTESPVTAGYNVYFNGWTRTTNPGQGGVGIHHPCGDIKKISTHNMTPVNGQVYDSNHWRVNWISTANGHSVTESGSSGSPLFTNNGRIIGQLHGGSSINCSDPANDPGEYGKFHLSWGGSSDIRRLRDWVGTSFTTNGRYYCDNLIISGPSKFCPSGTFRVNVTDDTNVTWSVSPSNAGTFSQNGRITSFARNGNFAGNATIRATIGAPCNTVITKSIILTGVISFTWQGIGPYGQVDVSVTNGSSPYKFYRNGSLIFTSGSSYVTLPFGCNGGLLKVEAQSQCGTASDSALIPSGCASTSFSSMVLLPNPASLEIRLVPRQQNLSISESDLLKVQESMEPITTEIYDFMGNKVRSITFKKNVKPIIDISALRKGTYFLRITGNEFEETHPFIKK